VVSLSEPGHEESVAVIVPPDLESQVRLGLAQADVGATVVVDEFAKGLEFDHTIVVAPDQIARGGKVGLRRLYICLTRATKRLVVVHTRELPEPLRNPDAPVDVRARIRENKLAKFAKVMAPRQAQLKVYGKAYAKWTPAEEEDLRRRVEEGLSIDQIADLHGRSPNSIRARIRKLR
jgi:DNA-binding CsgD family transcriptional regulator